MTIAYEVLFFYGLLAIWAVLLVKSVRSGVYRDFVGWGVVLVLFLNLRYFIFGIPDSISFFVGIYDVFDNIGLGDEGAPALAPCVENACSVWGDRFENHPSWGVAFYDRFLTASALRSGLLYGHIACLTVAFVLMHVQLWKPGGGSNPTTHRRLGRVSFGFLTLGVAGSVWLSTEHGSVSEYGGSWSMYGFWSMSAVVYGTAIMGVRSAKAGDAAAHRIWMIRYVGSMWGAFWLFRVMLVVTGPLLRGYESASLLLSIWLSAPLGVAIAEAYRRRLDVDPVSDMAVPAPAAA